MSADLHQTFIIDTSASEANAHRLDELVLKVMADIGAAMAKASTSAEGLGRSLAKGTVAATDGTKKLDAGIKALEDDLRKFEVAEKKRAEQFIRDQDRMTKAAQKVEREMEKSRETFAKAFKRDLVDSFSGAVNRAVGAVVQLGAVATAAIGGISFGRAISDALEFEAISARIQARAGGLSADSVKPLVGGLGSAGDLATGLEEVQKLGHEGAEALELLGTAAKTAKAEGAELGGTIRTLDDALDAYGLGVEHARDVTNLIAKGAKLAGADFDTYGAALTKVLPLTAQLGISFQDADAAIATMVQHGVGVERAGAALGTFLGKVSAQGKELSAAGINVAKTLREGGIEGLVKAIDSAAGDSAAALEKLGASSRTLGPVLTLLADDSNSVTANLEGLAAAGGTVEADFARITQTLAFQFDEFKNTAGLALLDFGQGFLEGFIPSVDAGTKSLKDLVAAGDLREWGREMAGAVQSVTDLFKPLVQVVGDFVGDLRTKYKDDSISAFEAIGGAIESFGRAAAEVMLGTINLVLQLGRGAALAARAVEIASNPITLLKPELSQTQGLIDKLKEWSEAMAKARADLANPPVKFDTGTHPIARIGEDAKAAIGPITTLGATADQANRQLAGIEDAARKFEAFKQAGLQSSPAFATAARNLVKMADNAKAAGIDVSKFTDAIGEARLVKPTQAAAKAMASFEHSLGEISESEFTAKAGFISEKMATLEAAGRTSGPLYERYAKALANLGEEATASEVPLGKFADAIEHGKDVLRANTQAKANALLVGDEMVELWKKETKAQEIAARQMGDDMIPLWKASTEAAQDFGNIVGDVFHGLVDGSTSVLGALQAIAHAFIGLRKGGASLADGLKQAGFASGLLVEKRDAEGKGTGQIDIGQSAAASSIALGHLLSAGHTGVRAVLGSGLQGAGIGFQLGGPIGAAIGGGIGAIAGAFKKTPEWQKVTKAVEQELGVALSEGTARAVADAKKQLGVSRSVAELIGLDKIVGEADLSKAGAFDTFTKKALESLQLIQSGGKGAAEAGQSIEAVYGTLISKAGELGLTGTEAFAALIKGAKASGIEVKSLGQALAGNAKAAGAAFSTLLQNSRPDGAGTLDALGALGKNVIDSLRQTGSSTKEIVDQIGSGLDALAEKQKKLGKNAGELPAELGSLIDFRNFAKENEDTFNSIDALVNITKQLGQAGFFTAEGFEAAQQQVIALDTQLLDARDNGKRTADDQRFALEQLAPALQEIINEHLRNGKAIDAETQKLIDQGVEFGLLNEKGTDLASNLHTEFDRLISALELGFGKKFPDAVARGAQQATDSIVKLSEAAKNATPKQIAEWEARTGRKFPGEDAGPVETHAGGGPGPGYTGRGEYVMSVPAVENAGGLQVMEMLHQALKAGRGAAAGAGRVINVILEVGGKRQLLQTIEDAIDSGDIRIRLSGAGVVR